MLANFWIILRHTTVLDILDICLIAFMIYYVLLLIKDKIGRAHV